MFRILEHTADVGFEATAESAELVLAEAVRAFVAVAFEADSIPRRTTRTVEVEGEDPAALLVNLLDEVLYLFDAGHFATADACVTLHEASRATVELQGEPWQEGRHRWRLMIKAVTYHGLEFAPEGDTWRARVFLDV